MKYKKVKLKILISLILLTLIYNACKKKPTVEQNSNIVWVVGDRTVMKSTNAGKQWNNIFVPDNFIVDLEIGGVDPNQVFRNITFQNTLSGTLCGDNGLIFRTKNAQKWDGEVISDATFYGSAIFDSVYYFCGGENRIIWSFYGWLPSRNDFASVYYAMDFVNDSTGWVVGDNSTVIYTKNNGENWDIQSIPSGNTFKAINIHLHDNGVREVWIAGNNGIIFKTTDDGINWSPVLTGITENLTSICFTNDETAYLTGENGIVLKTDNKGASFQKLYTGTSENLNSISFLDENSGFAVGNFGTFIKTEDAGNTWENVTWDKTKNLYCVLFVKRFPQK